MKSNSIQTGQSASRWLLVLLLGSITVAVLALVVLGRSLLPGVIMGLGCSIVLSVVAVALLAAYIGQD